MGICSKHMRSRARELRRAATAEEELLWSFVRDRRFGVRVRRQHPVGAFVVDFYCPAARVAVEIDGDHHDPLDDELRDSALLLQGVIVLRFSNELIHENVFAVLDKIGIVIAQRLRARGPSSPSPASGEGARGWGLLPLEAGTTLMRAKL